MKKDIAPSAGDHMADPGKTGDQLLMFSGSEKVLYQPGGHGVESGNHTEQVLFQAGEPIPGIQGIGGTPGEHNHGYVSDGVILTDPEGVLHQPRNQDTVFFPNGVILQGEPVAPEESALYQPGQRGPGPAAGLDGGVFPTTTANIANDLPLPYPQPTYVTEPVTYPQTTSNYIHQPQEADYYEETPIQIGQETAYYGDPQIPLVEETGYQAEPPVLYPSDNYGDQPLPYPQVTSNYGDPYREMSNNFLTQPVSNPSGSYPEDVLHTARVLPGADMHLVQRHRDPTADMSPLWS
jgi:hypothetical protein